MNIHWIQHVPFEGPAHIETIARRMNFNLSSTMVYEPAFSFPRVDDLDLLVIMGGPMGVHDTEDFPWLVHEKDFIREVIRRNKKVLGICLGAQIISDVMGAPVTKNIHREIGWHRVTPEKSYSGLFSGIFNESPEVFHWHGDTFSIPAGCSRICSSEACQNQAFEHEGRVLGLQFHLETTMGSAQQLINNCKDELEATGRYIQPAANIMTDKTRFTAINRIMETVFERIISG